jgi:HEAT repeat protein
MISLRPIALGIILILYAAEVAIGQAQDDVEIHLLSPQQLFDRWQNHEDPREREYAQRQLVHKGRRARSLAPQVMPLATSSDVRTRAEALGILGAISGRNSAVRALSVKGLKDKDRSVRRVAVFNVAYFGDISDLAPAIDDDNAQIRRQIAKMLFSIGERSAPLAATVAKRLSRESPGLRYDWIHALRRMGPKAAVAYPSLLPFVNDPGSNIRIATCWALVGINPDDKNTANAILTLLRDPDFEVREAATRAIMETSASGDDVILALKNVVRDHKGEIQVQAAATLYKLTKDPAALDILVKALESTDQETRSSAAFSVGQVKADADEIIQALEKGCSHDDNYTSFLAFSALRSLGRKGALNLIKLLDSTDESLRKGAAIELQCLEGDALPTAKEINPYFTRKDSEAIIAASNVAAMLGPEAKLCVPNLIMAMKHEDVAVRIAATKALGAIGPDSFPAVEILARSLRSTHAIEQIEAASALGALGDKAKSASPAIEEAMLNKIPDVQIAAAIAAWQIKRDPTAIRVLRDVWESRSSALAAAWLWRMERNEKAMIYIVDRFMYSPGTLECGVGLEERYRGRDEAIRFFRESCNDPDARISKRSKQALEEISPWVCP